MALARKIVQDTNADRSGPVDGDESLEEVYARARSAEAEADEILGEVSRRGEAGPELVAAGAGAPAETAQVQRKSEAFSGDEFLNLRPLRQRRGSLAFINRSWLDRSSTPGMLTDRVLQAPCVEKAFLGPPGRVVEIDRSLVHETQLGTVIVESASVAHVQRLFLLPSTA